MRRLKKEFEHVHLKRSDIHREGYDPEGKEYPSWTCYIPGNESASLGDIVFHKDLGVYVYYQMYEAILTAGQMKDIARFLHSIRTKWLKW